MVQENHLQHDKHSGKKQGFSFSVRIKDVWSCVWLKPKKSFGRRYFQLELPAEECYFEDIIILLPEGKEGKGWSKFAENIIAFVEAGFDIVKKRDLTASVAISPAKSVDNACKRGFTF